EPRDSVPRVLHAQAVQQKLRPPPRSLVRTKPSRRRLRGDLRCLARGEIRVGDALRGMAGAAQARIHGQADARARASPSDGEIQARRRSGAEAPQDAARTLPQKARALRARSPGLLRSRPPESV